MGFIVNCRKCGTDWGCVAISSDWQQAGLDATIEHLWSPAEKASFLAGAGCPQCQGRPEDDPYWPGVAYLLETENIEYYEAATTAFGGDDVDDKGPLDKVDRAFGFALTRLISQLECGDFDTMLDKYVGRHERDGWADGWLAEAP